MQKTRKIANYPLEEQNRRNIWNIQNTTKQGLRKVQEDVGPGAERGFEQELNDKKGRICRAREEKVKRIG